MEDQVAKLPDRSAFAGSVATTDRLVRTMVELAGVSVADAVKMASTTSARLLGVYPRKGSIAAGKGPDIVIFDSNINVEKVIVSGKVLI